MQKIKFVIKGKFENTASAQLWSCVFAVRCYSGQPWSEEEETQQSWAFEVCGSSVKVTKSASIQAY